MTAQSHLSTPGTTPPGPYAETMTAPRTDSTSDEPAARQAWAIDRGLLGEASTSLATAALNAAGCAAIAGTGSPVLSPDPVTTQHLEALWARLDAIADRCVAAGAHITLVQRNLRVAAGNVSTRVTWPVIVSVGVSVATAPATFTLRQPHAFSPAARPAAAAPATLGGLTTADLPTVVAAMMATDAAEVIGGSLPAAGPMLDFLTAALHALESAGNQITEGWTDQTVAPAAVAACTAAAAELAAIAEEAQAVFAAAQRLLEAYQQCVDVALPLAAQLPPPLDLLTMSAEGYQEDPEVLQARADVVAALEAYAAVVVF